MTAARGDAPARALRARREDRPGRSARTGTLEGPSSRFPSDASVLAAIVAVGAFLRVAYVLSLRPSPWFDHLAVDPEYYDAWARQIAAGSWIGERTFYMDPLYPYLLASLYRILGRDLLLVRLLNVAMSTASCLLVARIGRQVGGRAVGLLAALGFALYKPEIFATGEIDKTCLSVVLAAAALAFGLSHSPRDRFAAGVALGLGSLTRANFLAIAPFAALAFLFESERPRAARSGGMPAGFAPAALFTLGFVLSLAPVVWRNHRVSGEWVLTTAQAGQNFYTGNNPENPYGAFGLLPFVRANPHFEEADFRAEAERWLGRGLSGPEVSRYWFARAFAHMRERPGFAARAMLRKLALFWNDFEISDSQDQYMVERFSWVMRLPLLGFGWIAPLALVGAAVAFRTRREVRLLVGFVALYCASVVAFFLFARYRIQVVPALLPLAAVGAVDLAGRARAADARRLTWPSALLVVGCLFCFHTIGIFSRNEPVVQEMRLRHLAVAYSVAGRTDEALAALQEAVRQCPGGCRFALGDLFDLYRNANHPAEGADYFRAFTREQPGRSDGWRHLAGLLEASGQHEEAERAAARARETP